MTLNRSNKTAAQRLKSELRMLENQLEAAENKVVISDTGNNPFEIHQKKLIERITEVKKELANEELYENDSSQIDFSTAKSGESAKIVIKRNLDRLTKRIRSVQLEIQYSGGNTSKLRQELEKLEKQKKLFLEKKKVLIPDPKATKLKKKKKAVKATGLKGTTSHSRRVRITEPAKPTRVSNHIKIETVIVTVSWEHIFFEDGFIRIRIDKRKLLHYAYKYSQASFDAIKVFLIRRNIAPLQLQIHQGRIRAISNLDLLNNAIQYLRITEEWKNLTLDKQVNVLSILDSLGKLGDDAFDYFYVNKDRTPYLQELCRLQNLAYRIIPVQEPNGFKGKKISESFIFTIMPAKTIYLVWESVEDKKATFVFTSDPSEYSRDVQIIFDYISSELRGKRIQLRKGVTNEEGLKLKPYRVIYHTSFEKWKERILEYTGR